MSVQSHTETSAKLSTPTAKSLSADTTGFRYPKDYFEYKRALMKSSLSMKAKMLCEALASHGLRNAWSGDLMAEMSASINTVTAAKHEAMEARWLVRVFEGGPGSGKRDEFDLVIPVDSDDQSHLAGVPFTTGVNTNHKSCEPDTTGDTTGNTPDDDGRYPASSSPSGKSEIGQSETGQFGDPTPYTVAMCQRLNEHLDNPLDPGVLPSSARDLLQRMFPDPEDIPAREIGYGHLEDSWFNGPVPRCNNEAAVLASRLATADETQVRSWVERGAQRLAEMEQAELEHQDQETQPDSETEPEQPARPKIGWRAAGLVAERQAEQEAKRAQRAEELRLEQEIEAFWPQFEAVGVDRQWFDDTIRSWRKHGHRTDAQILKHMPTWLARETDRYKELVEEEARLSSFSVPTGPGAKIAAEGGN